ncbi:MULTISPECIES: hypothetical protein [Pseudomonas]|uniref:hypothetical protein n=1 Tax=Pseudomonas TaxID=286 RepID=UPI000E32D6C1|nr:hypothetical protein [Pseudomonas sp. UBA6554]AXQ48911.1 hypothetical protein DZC31_18545 [Stenotrophomonas rhizophila]
MSHQFKPGDLALIVGSRSADSPNVGRAVELIVKLAAGDSFDAPNGLKCCNASGHEVWVVQADGITAISNGVRKDIGGICLVREYFLIPLRGDFEPEQQKAKEAEPCA